MALVTLGELAETDVAEKDKDAFHQIILSLDTYYPPDWRAWEVRNFSFEELFGVQLDQKTDAKLRFAVPTIDIAHAFDPKAHSLSERRFRSIKARLLEWPLGRALIYAPHSVMERVHLTNYQKFIETVRLLKPKLLNRQAASSLLEKPLTRDAVETERSSISRNSSTYVPDDTPRAQQSSAHQNESGNQSQSLLIQLFEKQTEMFNKLLSVSQEQSSNIKQLIARQDSGPAQNADDLNESFESLPDSTQSDADEEPAVGQPESGPTIDNLSTREADLKEQIIRAQRELAALSNKDDQDLQDTGSSFDFKPHTTEAEPKLAKTSPEFLNQGIDCQRFNQDGWCSIRYADTQKQFQANPAFCALKTNSILAGVANSWKSTEILERADLTLGAITHGLLQQRKIFQDLDGLPRDVKNQVGKNFLSADSKFKKTSNDLLQYVCGRRAEIIQERRKMFKPSNKALQDILTAIPPSESHLFAETTLSEAIKEQGGVYNFFPAKKRPFQFKAKQRAERPKRENPKPDHQTFKRRRVDDNWQTNPNRQNQYRYDPNRTGGTKTNNRGLPQPNKKWGNNNRK